MNHLKELAKNAGKKRGVILYIIEGLAFLIVFLFAILQRIFDFYQVLWLWGVAVILLCLLIGYIVYLERYTAKKESLEENTPC